MREERDSLFNKTPLPTCEVHLFLSIEELTARLNELVNYNRANLAVEGNQAWNRGIDCEWYFHPRYDESGKLFLELRQFGSYLYNEQSSTRKARQTLWESEFPAEGIILLQTTIESPDQQICMAHLYQNNDLERDKIKPILSFSYREVVEAEIHSEI